MGLRYYIFYRLLQFFNTSVFHPKFAQNIWVRTFFMPSFTLPNLIARGLLSRKAGILLQICKFRGANKWRSVGFSQNHEISGRMGRGVNGWEGVKKMLFLIICPWVWSTIFAIYTSSYLQYCSSYIDGIIKKTLLETACSTIVSQEDEEEKHEKNCFNMFEWLC